MDDIKIEKYEDKFLVYTDGACPDNGTPKARSSIGIHFSEKNSIKLNDISEKLILNNIFDYNVLTENIEDYKKVSAIPKTYKPNPRGIEDAKTAPVNMPNQGRYPS